MKTKLFLILVTLSAMLHSVSAQDTVKYPDPWYQFKPIPDNPEPGSSYFTDDYCGALNLVPVINDREVFPIQPYPNTGNTIYGIAVTHFEHDNVPFDADLMLFRGVTIDNLDTLTGNVNITVSEKDSINTLNPPLRKQCVFEYEYNPGSDIRKFRNCTEYYFDTPIKLGRGKDSAGYTVFYLGGRVPVNSYTQLCSSGWDVSKGQQWYIYSEKEEIPSRDCTYQPLNTVYGFVWGAIFPIVRLRCTVPRGLRLADDGTGYWVSWQADTNAELFQLSVCAGDTPADSGILITTTDTGLALPSLAADTTYNVYLRKQCTYCTQSWADTVWSDWSSPATVEATSNGIDNLRQPSFSMAPNPASTAVTVLAGDFGGTVLVELLDINGRTAMTTEHPCTEPTTLSLAGLPRGTYLVRVTGNNLTAVRKLLVR